MTDHDDLGAGLRSAAGRFDPGDDGWAAIEGGVRTARRRRTARLGAAGGIAAGSLALAVGLWAFDGSGGTDVDAGPGPVAAPTSETTETAPTTTTSTTATTAAPAAEAVFPGIFPFASQVAIDRYEDGDDRLEDPVATADAFARDYLGMLDPIVGAAAPSGSGDVEVLLQPKGEDGAPAPDAGPRTLVTLRSFEVAGGGRVWTVVDARSPNIVVDAPTTGSVLGDAVTVRGRATGYEGTVRIDLRQDGMRAGDALAGAGAIAGTYGALERFEVAFAVPHADEPAGAVVVSTDTGLDGVGVPEATVVRIGFGGVGDGTDLSGPCSPPPLDREPAADEMDVTFPLVCDERFADDPTAEAAFVPTFRLVPRSPGVLQAALEALFAGPTAAERQVGLSSFFSEDTADLLAGVSLTDGTAVVDLAGTVNGASTSAGQLAFRGQLNRTVLRFPTIERIEYRLQGSCEAFWEWQQVGGCPLVTRADL